MRAPDANHGASTPSVDWLMRAAGNKAVAELITSARDLPVRTSLLPSLRRAPRTHLEPSSFDAVRGSCVVQRQSPKRRGSAACGEYELGEVAHSRSSGILDEDVRNPIRGELLVISELRSWPERSQG